MSNLFNIEGKFAMVTGASSGLGRQFALALAREGANVILTEKGKVLGHTAGKC